MLETDPYSVASVLERMGIRGVKVAGGKVRAPCPLHSDKTPSFGVFCGSGSYPRYHCFGCGASGDLRELAWHLKSRMTDREFLRVLYIVSERKPYREARAEEYVYQPYAEKAIYRPLEVEYKTKEPGRVVYGGYREVEEEDTVIDETVLEDFSASIPKYFVERGYGEEFLLEWECYDAPRDKRAIIPIRTWDGVLKGYSGRLYWDLPICLRCRATMGDDNTKPCVKCGNRSPKWLHSKGLDRNHVLYGEHKYQTGQIPVLVEGFFDVWTVAQWQRDLGPLAIMGASPGHSQMVRVLEKLRGTSIPVCVMGDNDDAGRGMNREVIRLIKDIELGRGVVVVEYECDRKDPGEFSEGDVLRLRDAVLDGAVRARRGEVVSIRV